MNLDRVPRKTSPPRRPGPKNERSATKLAQAVTSVEPTRMGLRKRQDLAMRLAQASHDSGYLERVISPIPGEW